MPCATQAEMTAAVEAAQKAFPSWAEVSILSRQRVMFNLQHLIREKMSELAHTITIEQGKTLADAEGDVLRGLREWVWCMSGWVCGRGCGGCTGATTPCACRGGGACLLRAKPEPRRHPQLPLSRPRYLFLPRAPRSVCWSHPVSPVKARGQVGSY